MRWNRIVAGFFAGLLMLLLAACGDSASYTDTQANIGESYDTAEVTDVADEPTGSNEAQEIPESVPETSETVTLSESAGSVSLSDIPAYSGTPYAIVNENVPFFSEAERTTEAFETYSDLDALGRCGVAYANICQELMPTEERGQIGEVRPTGWHLVKYEGIDGNYLYNRCHLIGFQLAGENANEKNLITGTRYLNMDGMLPYENLVADYVDETGNHVLYRVTPMFDGDNLMASGVLMEGLSVEDNGEGVCFNVYCYNVQPGIGIDYVTGDSWVDSTVVSSESASGIANGRAAVSDDTDAATHTDVNTQDATNQEMTYILNTNTKKFHYSDCSSVSQMKDKNKEEFTGTREEAIGMGYSPCGNCNP